MPGWFTYSKVLIFGLESGHMAGQCTDHACAKRKVLVDIDLHQHDDMVHLGIIVGYVTVYCMSWN